MSAAVSLELSGGQRFIGTQLGAAKPAVGKLVVCTVAMSPLRELKKREYAGAIVIFTTPHIWGTAADLEGAFAAGVVVREPESGDNERDIPNLDEILKDAGIAGVAGVDTRELTKLASSGSHTAEIKPIAA